MLLIVISECRKRAFTRSRRVLNKYLFQYGRRTWMGRLSQEGVEDLRKELKSKASRHMAVACHRIVGTRRTELLWIVGTRRPFSRSGEFAFAVTEQDVTTPVREKTEPERFTAHISRLAGLFHDLGKSVAGFQDKLRSGTLSPDAVRHDILSALLLLRLIGVPKGGKRPECLPTDPEWLKELRHPPTLQKRLEDLMGEDELFPENWLIQNREKQRFRSLEFLKPESRERPVLQWLLWLLAGHHRLPAGDTTKNCDVVLDASRHTNVEKDSAAFRRLTRYTPFWRENINWVHAVSQAADRLYSLLSEHDLNPLDLFPLMEAHARPSLVLADQTVSSEKETSGPLNAESRTIANTTKQGSGQDLAEHLSETGKRSSHFARLSLRRHPFPAIDPDELPESLCNEPNPQRGLERFRWQDRARLALRKRMQEGLREGGGFYLLMAGTGKGKTRTVPLLFSELSPKGLRYSLGLGLRTLTLQSGDSYRNEIGFDTDQTATLVGSPIARELHEIQREDSGATDPWNEEDFRIDDYSGDTSLDHSLDRFLRPKQRTLLAAPVTVSTVDHLIGPVSQRGTGSAAIQLRLMTSDLALDEIDQYNDRDLVNIGKLVRLSGIYGRKVILASATLPPAIAEHFFAAYHAGFSAFRRRAQVEAPLFCGWIAEETRIERDPDPQGFKRIHSEWAQALKQDLRDREPLRRAELIETGQQGSCAEDLRPLFAAVREKAEKLHGRHCVRVHQRRVSLGLVRWMNVPMCREFSRYLIDEAETEADVRVVCYHANHIPAMRFEIERVLDDLLHRKRDLRERLEAGDDTPGIAALRDALEDSDRKDLIVVVSATTIEDTGRDHDFDWAVWEPNDIRSAPQTAGRVMRHRTPASDKSEPNMAILRRNWRSAVAGSETPFSWPGPEGNAGWQKNPRHFRVKDYSSINSAGREDPGDFSAVGPMRHFESRVDATASISESPAGPLAALEHDRLRWLLGPRKEDPALDGLWGYLNRPDVRAGDLHIRTSPFRGGPERVLEFALLHPRDLDSPEWDWQWRQPGHPFSPADRQRAVIQERDFAHPERCFLRVDPKEAVRELTNRINGELSELIQRLTTIELTLYQNEGYCVLQFHPYLGGARHRTNFPHLERTDP